MAKKEKKAKVAKAAVKVAAIPGVPGLGDRARDKLTGYTGIVITVSNWLNGCVRMMLSSEKTKADGLSIEKEYVFDVQQLELLERNPHGLAPKAEAPRPGGDRDDPERPEDPQLER